MGRRPIYLEAAVRRRLCLGITLSFLLLTPACESYGARYPTDPEENYLVVHGMLQEGTAQQEITVEHTRGIGEGYFRGLTPASGAEVVVTGDVDHRFNEDPERPGIYVAAFFPRAGTTYRLEVRGADGQVLTGRTTVPDRSRFISPATDTTITWASYVTAAWSSVPAAAAYLLVDRAPGSATSWIDLIYPTILTDTALTMQPGKFGGNSFYLRVATVDSSFLAYTRGPAEDSIRSRIPTVISGGYGLFGSYALSDTRVISVK